MKNLFRKIGSGFAAIGRWIKETAWIQPLLIVGLIFAVIFSIPSVVGLIDKANEKRNSSYTYYKKFSYSLVNKKKPNEVSPAQKLLNDIFETQNAENYEGPLKGEKFMLFFVQETCVACEEAKPAIDNLNGKKVGNANFKFKTILTDQYNADEYKNLKDKHNIDNLYTTGFDAFLQDDNNIGKFETIGQIASNSYFYNFNKGLTEEDIQNLSDPTVGTFKTPTALLIDFSKERIDAEDNINKAGINNIFIGINGDTQSEKERFLKNAWNYTGDFGREA